MHPRQCTGRQWPSKNPAHWFPVHPSIVLIITGFLLSTSGGFSLVPEGFAGAIYFTASALTANDILTLFLVTLLILCSLSLDQLLNLIGLLKVMAFGPVDLAVQPITVPSLLGSHSFPAFSARDSFLAGGPGLFLLAGTRCALSSYSHHRFVSWLLIALLALSLTGWFVLIL